ncbi:MAG TPA: beta-ketoacyl synthase N-terminal-like domain-containing protein [Desulfobacterales bacterium]|nr:beta-ketoacyl synthase N-terminal-like domain-containing protein [Desulfobacterales bacterium]
MKAFIRGAGVVGGFGCGLSSLEAAIRKHTAPDSDFAASGSSAEVSAVSAFTAITDSLDRLIPPRTLRRVEHYARMAILASLLAIEDAGMGNGVPENTGLIVTTGMGPTANTLDLQAADVAAADLALSPILFSNSVQNAAAAYISMLLKIRGPSLSINQYEMAVPLAFQTAIDWLEEGRTESVLVGSIDCFSKALHEASLNCRNLKTGDGGQGAVPVGEGSAFFILTLPERQDIRCPFVQHVQMGGAHRLDAEPLPNTPIIHNGTGKNTDVMGQPPAHANFAHLYGTFPTSMGMDVAAAMLLLRTEHLLRLSFPQFDGGPAFHENPRIGCLKQGETGDWGMIVIGR